jgi:amino acid transporter
MAGDFVAIQQPLDLSVAVRPVAGDSNQLHRRLAPFGVLLLTLSCLSPVLSIYGIGSDVLLHAGTGAAGMFICGIGVAVVWAVVYAELGSAYPYAGGDYVGVGSILGPWAGFASLTIWAVTAAPNVAFLAKTIATYFSDLMPVAPPMIVTFSALGAAIGVALLAVRTSALVTGVFLAIEMLGVLVLIGAGLSHPVRRLTDVVLHPVALGAARTLLPVAIGAMALAGVSAAFATAGGNQAIAFGEELRQPHRHMGRVILLAGLIGAFATAVPVIAVVIGAGDLPSVLKSPAPFSAFITAVAGPVAGHALSVGVIVAIFNALIATIMFYARPLFSLGRDGLQPRLGERCGTRRSKAAPDRAAGMLAITAIPAGTSSWSDPGGRFWCRRSTRCGRRATQPIGARNNDLGRGAMASLRSAPARGRVGTPTHLSFELSW